MNPFDLRGPEFLLFYLVLGIATLTVLRFLRRANEADPSSHVMLDDYLSIAYLRGGRNEALRVATLNLINRGLLDVSADGVVRTRDAKAIPQAAKPLERSILQAFRDPGTASSIFSNAALGAQAAFHCEPPLVRLGLLPDEARSAARLRLWMAAVFVLAGVAAIKIGVAAPRGGADSEISLNEAVG